MDIYNVDDIVKKMDIEMAKLLKQAEEGKATDEEIDMVRMEFRKDIERILLNQK